jgi:hypothetical protein
MIFKLFPLIIGIMFDIIWCIKYPEIIRKSLIFEDGIGAFVLYGYNILIIVATVTNFNLINSIK